MAKTKTKRKTKTKTKAKSKTLSERTRTTGAIAYDELSLDELQAFYWSSYDGVINGTVSVAEFKRLNREIARRTRVAG